MDTGTTLVRLYSYDYTHATGRRELLSYDDDLFEVEDGAPLHAIWLAAQRRCSERRNYVLFAVGDTAYELSTRFNNVGQRTAALRRWADDKVHYPYTDRP